MPQGVKRRGHRVVVEVGREGGAEEQRRGTGVEVVVDRLGGPAEELEAVGRVAVGGQRDLDAKAHALDVHLAAVLELNVLVDRLRREVGLEVDEVTGRRPHRIVDAVPR